ncbi:MAG TPA: hypothetical protein EYO76_13815 [Flavobacteriaceae bacterium]|nr:hypothetical protein [Flavobacteriaceae bacterium]
MKVTNIKASFKWSPKIIIENNPNILDYFVKNIHIVKFDQYTACLMNNDSFCNLTGIKNVYHLLRCLTFFSKITNVINPQINYSIDSICATFQCKAGLKNNILKNAKKYGFSAEAKIKFCGVCIRSSQMEKCVIVYFQSGKANMLGLKTFTDMKTFYDKFIYFLNML